MAIPAPHSGASLAIFKTQERTSVFRQRPADSSLLLEPVRLDQQRLGRAPELLAGDAGFYSAENEREAHALGVQRVSIPNHLHS